MQERSINIVSNTGNLCVTCVHRNVCMFKTDYEKANAIALEFNSKNTNGITLKVSCKNHSTDIAYSNVNIR